MCPGRGPWQPQKCNHNIYATSTVLFAKEIVIQELDSICSLDLNRGRVLVTQFQ